MNGKEGVLSPSVHPIRDLLQECLITSISNPHANKINILPLLIQRKRDSRRIGLPNYNYEIIEKRFLGHYSWINGRQNSLP